MAAKTGKSLDVLLAKCDVTSIEGSVKYGRVGKVGNMHVEQEGFCRKFHAWNKRNIVLPDHELDQNRIILKT